MASFKAIVVMLIFSALVIYGMEMAGLNDTFRDPAMALVSAIVLLIALVVNVTIYLKVAGEAPFRWFNN